MFHLELRARFDRGDDPNDNSGQQAWAQQNHPFGQGGFGGFGGGGGPQHVFQQFFQSQAGGRGGGQQFHFQWG